MSDYMHNNIERAKELYASHDKVIEMYERELSHLKEEQAFTKNDEKIAIVNKVISAIKDLKRLEGYDY